VPENNIASFAGTGNPFNLGPINPGDVVVDVGSGKKANHNICLVGHNFSELFDCYAAQSTFFV
jgi:hypothetical protein